MLDATASPRITAPQENPRPSLQATQRLLEKTSTPLTSACSRATPLELAWSSMSWASCAPEIPVGKPG